MASPKERLEALRRRRPFVDHLLRTQEHYSAVKAGQQAGAVTYFGFLSFFPILALAFAAVGWITGVFPEARATTVDAIAEVFPGMIGYRRGPDLARHHRERRRGGRRVRPPRCALRRPGLALQPARRAAGRLRAARVRAAELRHRQAARPGHAGRGRPGAAAQRRRLRAGRPASRRTSWTCSVWAGAPAAAVGAGRADRAAGQHGAVPRAVPAARRPAHPEALAAVRGRCSARSASRSSSSSPACCSPTTKGQPAFQAFGIALILVVWINYFSRVVLYAAAWAHTSPAARAEREDEAARCRRAADAVAGRPAGHRRRGAAVGERLGRPVRRGRGSHAGADRRRTPRKAPEVTPRCSLDSGRACSPRRHVVGSLVDDRRARAGTGRDRPPVQPRALRAAPDDR